MNATTETLTIDITMTDLQHDGCGWSVNGCWVRRETITVPANLSDRAIARRILSAIGGTGARRDEWAGSDWSWRNGSVGIYADVNPFADDDSAE